MTITIDLTEEQETRLKARTKAAGMNDPAEYLRRVIDGEPTDAPPYSDMAAYLRKAGVLGAVKGTPRVDGRPWSEIEAAYDVD